VGLLRGLGSFYWRIGRTYVSKAGSLLPLAAIVFVPVGFLDALTTGVDIETLDPGSLVKLAATIGAVAAITMTGLLGEVFYSGAVAVSLTHPTDEKPPSILAVARRLDYRRLILVDIAYVALVIVGLVAFFIPGILVFVWFGLAGPVVELEGRPVVAALRRSASLVRHHFWSWLRSSSWATGSASSSATSCTAPSATPSSPAGWRRRRRTSPSPPSSRSRSCCSRSS
jgi:hypothetical protein